MQEMKQAVATAFERVVAAGLIETAIEERLTKTVTEMVKDELGSYSEFGKALKEQVKAALQVNFTDLGLPGYNDLILKIVRKQVEADVNRTLTQQVEQQMAALLEPAPASIKLSELVEQFIEAKKPDAYSCSCDDSTQISLHVEESQYGSRWIAMDAEEGKDRYRCAIRFGVTDEGRFFGLRLDEKKVEEVLFVGPIYDFERSLFQMYAAGTKVVIDGDEHSINTHYPGHDD